MPIAISTSAVVSTCDWATTETKIVDTIKDLGAKALKLIDSVQKAINDVRDAVRAYQDSFLGSVVNFVSLGTINAFIDAVFAQLNFMVTMVKQAVQAVVWVVPQIMAPWVIRSIGRQMQSMLVGKVTTFSNGLDVSHMASPKSWDSPAGKEWLAQANAQKSQGGELAIAATKAFADAVTHLGDRAVAATTEAAGDLTGGITDIFSAISDLKSITKVLPKLLKAVGIAVTVISIIWALVKLAHEIASSSQEFSQAASSAITSGWPDPTSR